MTRRLFIKHCSIAAVSPMFSKSILGNEAIMSKQLTNSNEYAHDSFIATKKQIYSNEKKRQWGIQLYSLKDQFSLGVEVVIKQVADAGYSFVEPYGYSPETGFWGLKAREFKSILDRHGLIAPSCHYDFGSWEKSIDNKILEGYVEVANILEHQYITVPYIDPAIFQRNETVKIFSDKLNSAGQFFKKNGFMLAYHNHDFEFQKVNGFTPYHTLLKETDKDLVKFELDIYWAVRAGHNVPSLFADYPGRFPMWHIKDMDKLDASKNTEIGQGMIDFKALLKDHSGLKYAFVEQENFNINAFDSIKKSIKYLKDLGG